MRNDNKSNGTEVESIREQALTDAAKSVKSIRQQKDAEPGNEYVINALKNSEEAMFFLACNAGDDDEKKSRRLLKKHGLDDIR